MCHEGHRQLFFLFSFQGNLYLSFLEVLVCVQNEKRDTDLYNKLADAHLHFSSKAKQLFILTQSRAKQVGLILLPILAILRLLSLVPEGSCRRQCHLHLGHRQSSSMHSVVLRLSLPLLPLCSFCGGKIADSPCSISGTPQLVCSHISIQSPIHYSSPI